MEIYGVGSNRYMESKGEQEWKGIKNVPSNKYITNRVRETVEEIRRLLKRIE